MRDDKAFLDTNVIVYAFGPGNDRRTVAAIALLSQGCVVSVQTLNEFVAVARRKLAMSWDEVLESLSAIRDLCSAAVPLTLSIHDNALRISQRHGYNIYDSLIIAAALEASCSILYSEDMRDGHTIDGLTIRNPFSAR